MRFSIALFVSSLLGLTVAAPLEAPDRPVAPITPATSLANSTSLLKRAANTECLPGAGEPAVKDCFDLVQSIGTAQPLTSPLNFVWEGSLYEDWDARPVLPRRFESGTCRLQLLLATDGSSAQASWYNIYTHANKVLEDCVWPDPVNPPRGGWRLVENTGIIVEISHIQPPCLPSSSGGSVCASVSQDPILAQAKARMSRANTPNVSPDPPTADPPTASAPEPASPVIDTSPSSWWVDFV